MIKQYGANLQSNSQLLPAAVAGLMCFQTVKWLSAAAACCTDLMVKARMHENAEHVVTLTCTNYMQNT